MSEGRRNHVPRLGYLESQVQGMFSLCSYRISSVERAYPAVRISKPSV